MKIFSLALLAISLFLLSCAGGPEVGDKAPDWAASPPAETQTFRVFRGKGRSGSVDSGRDAAIADLKAEILTAMNLEESDAFDALFDTIENKIRNPAAAEFEGVQIVHNEGWKDTDGGIVYLIDITWEREAFEKQRLRLAEIEADVSPERSEFEKRALAAEEDGNIYESALIWAAAAGMARADGNISGYRSALDEIARVLESLDFQLVSSPDSAFVGLRPESPVSFRISSRGSPVSNAEFVISYPKNSRDGSPSRAQARIISDDKGIVRFLPPEVPYAGKQVVSIAVSAEPFLEYIGGDGDAFTGKWTESLETARLQAEYEGLSRIRTIPTGILILETDLAGNPLNTADTARGLLDDLSADGFNVSIMDLDPSQMLSRSDQALLRDLKADSRYSDKYQRVVYGTVALDSFEEKGGNYTVKVSGTLVLSDLNRQVILHKSEISKSSQASNSLQAISAAFRQLGRSFAGELISQAP
jgi:hypothetical protein